MGGSSRAAAVRCGSNSPPVRACVYLLDELRQAVGAGSARRGCIGIACVGESCGAGDRVVRRNGSVNAIVWPSVAMPVQLHAHCSHDLAVEVVCGLALECRSGGPSALFILLPRCCCRCCCCCTSHSPGT
jgi:hypothetical protein